MSLINHSENFTEEWTDIEFIDWQRRKLIQLQVYIKNFGTEEENWMCLWEESVINKYLFCHLKVRPKLKTKRPFMKFSIYHRNSKVIESSLFNCR